MPLSPAQISWLTNNLGVPPGVFSATAGSAGRTGVGPVPIDPAAGKPLVERAGAGSGTAKPLGSIGNYNASSAAQGEQPNAFPTQGRALRDPVTGELQSVDEHVWARGIQKRITTDPATGDSPITDAVYRRETVLRTASETGGVKTVADNEAMGAFDDAASAGRPMTPAEMQEMTPQAAVEREFDAARSVGDSSVTAENTLTAVHGELGDVSRAGNAQAQDFMKDVPQEEIDAWGDNIENVAATDGQFLEPQGMGLPMPEDPVPVGAGAGASELGGVGAGAMAEAGVIGAVVAGGVTAFQDADQVRDGRKKAGDATAEVAVATGVGAAAGVAGMVAGAEIGAAVGTAIPVPIVGTAVGLVAGAVVGGVVGYVGSELAEHTGATKAIGEFLDDHFEQPLKAAWDDVATGVDAVKSTASDVGGAIADGASAAAGAVADVASDAASAVSDAGSAVADGASAAADAVGNAASDAASAVSDAGSAIASGIGGLFSSDD